MSRLSRLIETYSLNRVTRIKKTLEPQITFASLHFNAESRETVDQYVHKLHIIQRRLHTLTGIKSVVILLLYASFMSAFFQNTIFEEAFSYATVVSGLIGSTVLFLVFTGLSRLTNIYVSDAHTIASLLASFIESEKRAIAVTKKVEQIVKKDS